MAPLTSRRLALLLLAASLLAGCTGDAGERTGVADATVGDTATPSAPTDDPVVPRPPDLSTVVIDCDAVEGPCDYGDDPRLDRMWDACAAGDGGACDRLYYDSGFDTRYEQFGNTCGDRGITMPCPGELRS